MLPISTSRADTKRDLIICLGDQDVSAGVRFARDLSLLMLWFQSSKSDIEAVFGLHSGLFR